MSPITFLLVTPSYNQGEFLRETIESVMSQEGNFYINYFLADGGSTDNSVQIIKEYEALLREGKWNVRCLGINYEWVSEEDKGQSDAINKAMKRGRGDVAGWLNSDDYFPSNDVLKSVSEEFEREPEMGIVYGNSDTVDIDKNFIRSFKGWQIELKDILIQPSGIVVQPSLFFKRDIFIKAGGLREDFHLAFDYDLWFNLFLEAKKYKYIDKTLSCARYHADAKSVKHMRAQVIELCKIKFMHLKSFKLSSGDTVRLYFNMLCLFVYYYAVKFGFKKAC